jgi:hypothetical protein
MKKITIFKQIILNLLKERCFLSEKKKINQNEKSNRQNK